MEDATSEPVNSGPIFFISKISKNDLHALILVTN